MTGQVLTTPRSGPPSAGRTAHLERPRPVSVVSSVKSDSHTWNLIYLELVLRELGHHVVNLGPCVPDEMLADECVHLRPDLVVLSSVNGHGLRDGAGAAAAIRRRRELTKVPIVIGGRLTVSGELRPADVAGLRRAGVDAVLDEVDALRAFAGTLSTWTTP